MKMTRIIGFFLLLTVSGCSQKDNKSSTESKYLSDKSQPVIESFFNEVKSGNYKSSIHNLLSKNENIDLKDSLTINLENKFIALNQSSGMFVSKRLIRKKELGDDLGVYIYLAKYDQKFYRFSFTFYNNGTTVRIYKFSFDDSIDIELEDGLKLYVN